MFYRHPLEIPKSSHIIGFRWLGDRSSCPVQGIHGDTHPMTWAADDEIYMSAGDPNWAMIDGKPTGVTWAEAILNPDLYPHMGGVDVEKLTGFGREFGIDQINTMPGLMGPGGLGVKPSGMISVKGSLYLAVQNLLGNKPPAHREKCQHGTDSTILRSDDFGKTWYPDIQPALAEFESKFFDRKGWKWLISPEERQSWQGWKPMFPGAAFGGPSFIQYGKDNSEAVDGYIYAVSGDQWDNGSELRLGRVPQDRILEIKAWEWAVVQEKGKVNWVSSLHQSKPILNLDGHLGLPEMIFLPGIQRYLLLTWGLHRDFHVEEGSEFTILESKNPWGPFNLVYYEEIWDRKEVCPYCPRIPLKWFDEKNLSGWLLHSGNWFSPEPYYKPHIRPFQLILGNE